MAKTSQDQAAKALRREQLVDRLPVILDLLIDAISVDTDDNPATYELAAIALEASRELQDLEATRG